MGSVAPRSQYRLWEEKANEEKNNDNQKEAKILLAAIIWKGILMLLLHIELLQTQSENQINNLIKIKSLVLPKFKVDLRGKIYCGSKKAFLITSDQIVV